MQRSIPIEEAVDARINLIKEYDMWKNPEEDEFETESSNYCSVRIKLFIPELVFDVQCSS